MLRKIVPAVIAGSAVTFGLFFLMQALIASGQSVMTSAQDGRVVDFVRVEREETVERRRSKPRRPSNPEAPPPDAPQPSLDQRADIGGQAVTGLGDSPASIGNVDMDIGSGFGVAAGSADGDYLPIVKVAPIYPPRALERGIEGYVILEFTVTKTGSVEDARVVEYEPSTLFNRAAIRAALKFKYKPRIVSGVAIEVRGVLHKLTFRLVDK